MLPDFSDTRGTCVALPVSRVTVPHTRCRWTHTPEFCIVTAGRLGVRAIGGKDQAKLVLWDCG
jgi:hypothetical protein